MSLLTEVLAHPQRLASLSDSEWDGLLRLARHGALLGTLYCLVEEQGNMETIPAVAREVLSGAQIQIEYRKLLAKRELADLGKLFTGVEIPVVLVKGAAYLAAQLPPARGRRLNDVDILVPKRCLAEAEQVLSEAGWRFDRDMSDYDQRYYRDWTHELPPLHHANSPIELDVHHNLIQPTSRIKLDADLLFAELVPIEGTAFSTLSPQDMVLHSATHLFMSDELRGGLRDVVDMHLLCNHFAEQDADYWQKLATRAELLGLQRPLYYAASAMRRILGTRIPEDAWRLIERNRPSHLVDRVMRGAIDQHIAPVAITKTHSGYAEQLLYLRSHWIRMPPLMLVKHLAYKWMANFRSAKATRQS